jgi:hypothetical protein
VQTGIPQGGFAAPAIAQYLAGAGPTQALSYVPGQYDDWHQQVATDATTGAQLMADQGQAFASETAANAALAEATGMGYNPAVHTMSPTEYNTYVNTIQDEMGMPDYNPAVDILHDGSDDFALTPAANEAADNIYMGTTGNNAGDYHAGNLLAPNIFGTGPSFANPGESGSYGGSLVTGNGGVAGSELEAGINSMINNSIAGSILGTDLPTYASGSDLIAAETAAYNEALANGAPAFDMNDPSTFITPSDDPNDHFNPNNDGDPTNDTGNAGWGFTSIADMFDGGGAGTSGDSYTGGIHGDNTVGDTSKGVSSIVSGGDDGGDSGGSSSGSDCVIATFAKTQGVDLNKREAVKWCMSTLHDNWAGELVRLGYQTLGRKAINAGKATEHFEEFKRYVDYARGQRKDIGAALTFYGRTSQFFIVGLWENYKCK